MSNTIIVINAGSLSLKFGAYAIGAGRALEVLCGLRIDHRLGDPHFIAKNPDGKPLGAHMWLLRIGNRSRRLSTDLSRDLKQLSLIHLAESFPD